jgi:excisionase family DNA binding protein
MEGYNTIEQVATHYQVSISTVRSWIRDKLIPFIKVGGMYRFKMSEVDAAFLLRTKQHTAVPVVPVVPVVEQATVAIPPTVTVAPKATAAAFNPDQDI